MCALGGLVKDNEKWKKYVEICSRNHRKVSADLDAYISDVIRNHDEGNDQFKITGWFDNYDMRAVPMIMSQNEKFTDFQNAVILQPLDGFLCPIPEMKARDACIPFLLFKHQYYFWISELF